MPDVKVPPTLRRISDLAAAGLVHAADIAPLEDVAARYAVAVPAHMMTPAAGALSPALARQFIPDVRELEHHPAEVADPIGDGAHTVTRGLVHRYRDRVLLKLVDVCPVYCRFCFRREMVGPGGDGFLSSADIDAAIAYIAAHPHIWEVIVTGGDPLAVAPRRLAEVSRRIAAIAHVKALRWHTRVPVVAPDRVTRELIAALSPPGVTSIVAIHANHGDEFSDAARSAIAKLRQANVMLVSQSVLLAGVNTAVAALADLMRAFITLGIKPYYLHHPDLAPGTGHFRISIADGRTIMRDLTQTLSGIAMPDYKLDIPGGFGKISVMSDAVLQDVDDPTLYTLRDPSGQSHKYRDIA